MKEKFFRGVKNRLLQCVARFLPGARTLRPRLHRARGVRIGAQVWIGYDVILETSRPYLITIEDGAGIGMRAMIDYTMGKTVFFGPLQTIGVRVVADDASDAGGELPGLDRIDQGLEVGPLTGDQDSQV